MICGIDGHAHRSRPVHFFSNEKTHGVKALRTVSPLQKFAKPMISLCKQHPDGSRSDEKNKEVRGFASWTPGTSFGDVLLSHMKCYNGVRTHSSLKDAPVPRAVERAGHILCRPVLGGPHHQYVRI
jgi:hypothetical protein